MAKRLGIRLAAALTGVCLALSAGAADVVPPPATPAPAAPAAEPPATTIIPAPEIVSRAEDAKSLARRIRDQLEQPSQQDEIAAKLPETADKLRERRARALALLDSSPTIDALSDLDSEWRSRARVLAEWRVALTRRAQLIESSRAELQQEREIWARTQADPETQKLPPATLARVDETLRILVRADQVLQSERVETLDLQSKVAEEETVVGGMVNRIAKLSVGLGERILQRDAPPLWSRAAFAPSGDPDFVPAKLRAAFDRRADLAEEFRDVTIRRLQFEALVFALVLIALVAARRRVRSGPAPAEGDRALEVSRKLLERPVSAAIVVAFTTAAWFLPRPPGYASEIEALLLLWPLSRLLPSELWRELRPGMIGLAAIFLVGSARQLLSALPVVERFLILPELFGLIAFMVWLFQRVQHDQLRGLGRAGPIARPFAQVGFVLCVAALVANFFGFALLSRVILRGVLAAVYSAVALFALVRLGRGIVTGLVRSAAAQRLRIARDHGELVRTRVGTWMVWAGFIGWAYATLQAFGIDRVIASSVSTMLGAKLEVGTVSISLGNLVAFGVTLWVSFLLSRLLRFILDEDVLPRLTLPRGVPSAISTGAHYLILVAGFLIAIGAAGIDLGRFTLLAGALGVGIGFGLQNVVNNFVSGLILLFERPVQTGDMVEVGPLQGEVKRIGIRSSTIRTFDGADVIVPNAALISERLVNWTFSDRTRRVDLEVGIAYGSDPNKVLAILLETARAHSEVLSLPEPAAFFTKFQDSALAFQLRVWCRFELAPRIKSELGIAVHEALRGAGIEIPFPQTDVHLKVESGQD